MQFLLVGANHAHQLVDNPHGQSKQFFQFLVQCCTESSVDLIAEEMSTAALIKYATTSIALHAADSVKITHLLCDPDLAERTALGVPSEAELRDRLCPGVRKLGDDELINEAIKSYWPIREGEWLRRVGLQRCKCCLFILGPDHVSSFSRLLIEKGYSYRVVSERWEP